MLLPVQIAEKMLTVIGLRYFVQPKMYVSVFEAGERSSCCVVVSVALNAANSCSITRECLQLRPETSICRRRPISLLYGVWSAGRRRRPDAVGGVCVTACCITMPQQDGLRVGGLSPLRYIDLHSPLDSLAHQVLIVCTQNATTCCLYVARHAGSATDGAKLTCGRRLTMPVPRQQCRFSFLSQAYTTVNNPTPVPVLVFHLSYLPRQSRTV